MLKQIGIVVIVVLLIIFGFVLLNHASAPKEVSPQHKMYTLVVKDNKLISGPTILTATQGDTVTIAITANVNGELHLHGYDKHVNFFTGKKSSLTVFANTAGRFPYELEDSKTEIGALEVQPK